MSKKLKVLILLNVVLIIALISSWKWNDWKNFSSNSDTGTYALADTGAILRAELGQTILEKQNSKEWLINQKWIAAPEKINDWLTVLVRIQEKRNITQAGLDSVKQILHQRGLQVSLFSKDGLLKKYKIAGNKDETYLMMEGEKPIVVHVPHFLGNLVPFFSADDTWRERRVLMTSWRTLKSYKIDYEEQKQDNIAIDFDSVFYKVQNVGQLDTAKLFQYIDRVENFRVKQFLPKNSLEESLVKLKPYCKIEMQDLDKQRSNSLSCFMTDSIFYGINHRTNEIVSIDKRAMQMLLVKPSFFEKRKSLQLPFSK
ncbi:MAG: hypothetical protein OHK0038_06450 [Flammeovirgaceae bacterium]